MIRGVGFPGAEIGGVSPNFQALEGSLIHSPAQAWPEPGPRALAVDGVVI